jgi:uncharacterized membrane protein YecN with MAPEG domain
LEVIDAEQLRQSPEYQRATRLMIWAVKFLPVSLIWGAVVTLLSRGPWAVWLWLCVIVANVLVFAVGEGWRTYIFVRAMLQEIRQRKSGTGR